MKRRTIVSATSFVLFVLLATCVSTGAHAQSRSTVSQGIFTLSQSSRGARVRVDGISGTGTSSFNAQPASGGPPGPRGPEGPRGVAGPRGPQGVAGAPGAPGAPGQVGQPGQPGPTGPTGLPGGAGSQGTQGVAGPIGPSGIPGLSISDIAGRVGITPIVSSNAPGSTGTLAVDYDLTTAWTSAINDPTPTITLNMSGVVPISAIQLYWGDATPRTFHLETCVDITPSAIRSHALPHFHGIRPHGSTTAASCIPANGQTAAPWTTIPGTTYTNDTSRGNFITFPKFSTQYIRLVSTNTTSTSYVLDEFGVLTPYWFGG